MERTVDTILAQRAKGLTFHVGDRERSVFDAPDVRVSRGKAAYEGFPGCIWLGATVAGERRTMVLRWNDERKGYDVVN